MAPNRCGCRGRVGPEPGFAVEERRNDRRREGMSRVVAFPRRPGDIPCRLHMTQQLSQAAGNRYLEESSHSAALHARARAVMPGGNTRTTVFTHPYPAYVAFGRGAS